MVTRRYIFFSIFLLICICFVGITEASNIYTGVYGIWGWYADDQKLQMVRDSGFDLVITGSAGHERAFLDKAARLKLKCVVGFWLTKDIARDQTRWHDFLRYLREKVAKLKDHPAVFAWYLVDEPDWNNISFGQIKEMTAIVKAIDKVHPTFTVLTVPENWADYLSYFDIIGIDPYLRKNNAGVPDKASKVSVWISKLKNDLSKRKLNREIWVILGAFDQVPKNELIRSYSVRPSPSQYSEMVDIALKEGVNGIFTYSLSTMEDDKYKEWVLRRDDPELWEAVRKSIAKIKSFNRTLKK